MARGEASRAVSVGLARESALTGPRTRERSQSVTFATWAVWVLRGPVPSGKLNIERAGGSRPREEAMAKWNASQTDNGTEYTTAGGRVAVRKVSWQKPGFSNQTSSGWAIFVDGERFAPATKTAIKAMGDAEMPGTWKEIQQRMSR